MGRGGIFLGPWKRHGRSPLLPKGASSCRQGRTLLLRLRFSCPAPFDPQERISTSPITQPSCSWRQAFSHAVPSSGDLLTPSVGYFPPSLQGLSSIPLSHKGSPVQEAAESGDVAGFSVGSWCSRVCPLHLHWTGGLRAVAFQRSGQHPSLAPALVFFLPILPSLISQKPNIGP